MIGERHDSPNLKLIGGQVAKETAEHQKVSLLVEGGFPTPRQGRLGMQTPAAIYELAFHLLLNKLIPGHSDILRKAQHEYLEKRDLTAYEDDIHGIEPYFTLCLPHRIPIELLRILIPFTQQVIDLPSLSHSVPYDPTRNLFKTYLKRWKVHIETFDKLRARDVFYHKVFGELKVAGAIPESFSLPNHSLEWLSTFAYLLSKESSTKQELDEECRIRSAIHAENIQFKLREHESDILITVTGAAHVPEILEFLDTGLVESIKVLFTDNIEVGLFTQIHELKPDVSVYYVSQSP
jgi:hypothetical protein